MMQSMVRGPLHQVVYCTMSSDVPARLGLKAAALARPEPAPAFSKAGPGQSRQTRLGPGPARLKPRLLADKTFFFSDGRERLGTTVQLI